MKIDVTEIHLGLITHRDSLLKRDLYYDLHEQVYGHAPRKQWQPANSTTLRILTGTKTDLSHMAHELRHLGWAAYYWQDRHGVSHAQGDTNTWINYGRREGLIIGRYCANLTAWLLAHT